MFETLGVDWAGSLLGFLAVAFMPIPFLFYLYGEKLRKGSRYAPTDFGNKGKGDEESQDDTKANEGSNSAATPDASRTRSRDSQKTAKDE